MATSLYVPMTGEARDALIAICVLWILFAATVFFRMLGRIRGAGVGADDVLSLIALVSCVQCIYLTGAMSLMKPGSVVHDDRNECWR